MKQLTFTPHPEKSLQLPWNLVQAGVLIFFLLPIWGGVAISLGVLITLKQCFKQIVRQPVVQALAILTTLLVITSFQAELPGEALLGLGNFLPYFLVFIGLSCLIRTDQQLRHLAWLIVLPASLVTILGLGQQFLNWSGVESLQSLFGWVLVEGGNPPGRMASVFMYANLLAAYLVVVFALALGLLLEQIVSYHPTQRFQVALLSITLLIVGVGLIFTNSRNAWGVAVLISLAYVIYLGWYKLLYVFLGAVAAVFAAAFAPNPVNRPLRAVVPAYFWQRLTDQNFERPIETLRITQWKFAWNLASDRPWLGWGMRNFTPLYESQMQVWMGHPHSLFLMMVAEVGFPISLFFGSIVGWILAKGIIVARESSGAFDIAQGNGALRFANGTLQGNSFRDGPLGFIFAGYVIAFGALIVFNCFDVTIFDLRINTLGWLVLAGIHGVSKTVNLQMSVE
ncbi:MAG: O-antigen ligase family protein [Microcoleaceae cyanobacterium]